MTRNISTGTAIIAAISGASILFAASVADAQAIGNILQGGDFIGLMSSVTTYGIRIGQYGLALAGMWKGVDVWQGSHNIWHAALPVLGGAGLFFGVPAATGIPIL